MSPVTSARPRARLASLLSIIALVGAWLAAGPAAGAAADPRLPPLYSRVLSPTAGGAVPVGTPLIIAGSASQGEAPDIQSVDVSVDGGVSWLPAEGTETWSMVYTPTEEGQLEIVSRASDSLSTQLNLDPPVAVTVGTGGTLAPVHCPCTLQLPDLANRPRLPDPDQFPVNVGLRFRLDRDAILTGMRILRNPYTEVINTLVQSSDGTALASASPAPSPAAGPTVLTLIHPLPVVAGETYVISFQTFEGHYDSTEDYFDGVVLQPPFVTVFDELGGAGVYRYNDPADPHFVLDQVWHNSNYWISPIVTIPEPTGS
jgi:hypothetical protein